MDIMPSIIVSPRYMCLNAFESYNLQDPLFPHLLNPHLRHEVSIKTPKYTGAGIPARTLIAKV